MPKQTWVFFDILIGKAKAGRLEMYLYDNLTPKTAENFRCLCTGEKWTGSGLLKRRLHYKGSVFHRIFPGILCQGGDFTHGNGTGGLSIYGPKFEDENFLLGHGPKSGILSMANYGPNTNGSQFLITRKSAPWLDGKHVVFGRVVEGLEVLWAMEQVGSESGATSEKVVIEDCGEITDHANPVFDFSDITGY